MYIYIPVLLHFISDQLLKHSLADFLQICMDQLKRYKRLSLKIVAKDNNSGCPVPLLCALDI